MPPIFKLQVVIIILINKKKEWRAWKNYMLSFMTNKNKLNRVHRAQCGEDREESLSGKKEPYSFLLSQILFFKYTASKVSNTQLQFWVKIHIWCKSWMGQILIRQKGSQLNLGIPTFAGHLGACPSWTYCTYIGISREVPLFLFSQISPGNLLCYFA